MDYVIIKKAMSLNFVHTEVRQNVFNNEFNVKFQWSKLMQNKRWDTKIAPS